MDAERTCDQLQEVCRRLARAVISGAAPADLQACLRDIASGRALFDALESLVARELLAVPGRFVEKDVADAQRTSVKHGQRTVERVTTIDAAPALGDALANGQVLGGHVDALSRVLRNLDDGKRQQLTADDDHLAVVAKSSTIEQFDSFLRNEVRRLDDGIKTLERQRASTFVKTWIDRVSGMVNLRGEFDPERGALLMGRLSNVVEAMFHDGLPADCPSGDRQQPFLQGLALLEIITPTAVDDDGVPIASGAGLIDLAIVVDHRTLLDGPHADSIVDCGNDIHLPLDTIRRLACLADVTVLTMRDGVVLDEGRTKRTATRAQRRALRAMYPRCALFDCDTEFRHCKIHHITWWRHLGPTDIANLVPLCSKHHHLVHEGGWKLVIDPHTRELRLTDPTGAVHDLSPPRARSA